jgi:hypothetical protein
VLGGLLERQRQQADQISRCQGPGKEIALTTIAAKLSEQRVPSGGFDPFARATMPCTIASACESAPSPSTNERSILSVSTGQRFQ